MAVKDKRFTIYDMMEAKGLFEANPANQSSQHYKGPIRFPKMLYHPKGEEIITVQAEVISTPLGPKEVGEQREIVHMVVNTPNELKAALDDGWHEHPADAIEASGKKAPPKGAGAVVSAQEKEIARLNEELEELRLNPPVARPSAQIASKH